MGRSARGGENTHRLGLHCPGGDIGIASVVDRSVGGVDIGVNGERQGWIREEFVRGYEHELVAVVILVSERHDHTTWPPYALSSFFVLVPATFPFMEVSRSALAHRNSVVT